MSSVSINIEFLDYLVNSRKCNFLNYVDKSEVINLNKEEYLKDKEIVVNKYNMRDIYFDREFVSNQLKQVSLKKDLQVLLVDLIKNSEHIIYQITSAALYSPTYESSKAKLKSLQVNLIDTGRWSSSSEYIEANKSNILKLLLDSKKGW